MQGPFSVPFELRHLRYFLAVAKYRHFRKASEELGITQPPLTRQIQELERGLGVELLKRNPRGVSLTHAGKVMSRESRRILKTSAQSIRMVRRAARADGPSVPNTRYLKSIGREGPMQANMGAQSSNQQL